jgi:hypothetical protein
VTNVHGWMGGWSPAARFLVPIAPLLWVGVYLFASQARSLGKAVVAALVVVQVAIDAFVWQFPKALWNDGDGVSAFRGSGWLPTWTDPGAAQAFVLLLCAAVAFAFVGSRYLCAWNTARS